jgi:hypothetical protein
MKYFIIVSSLLLSILCVVSLVAGKDGHTGTGIASSSIPEGTEGLHDSVKTGEDGVPEAQPAAASYDANLRFSGSVLKPRTSNVEWHVGGEGGCLYASSGDQYTWFTLPVTLPQGATVRYFRMYYNDQSATINCAAYFTVYDLYGSIVTEWGIFSSGTGQSYATTSEFEHTIDYSLYSYVIHWSPNVLGSDMQVCGFRLFYSSPPTETKTKTVVIPLLD